MKIVQKKINFSINELQQEKQLVSNLLSKPKFRMSEYEPKEIFSWVFLKDIVAPQHLSIVMKNTDVTNYIKKSYYDKIDKNVTAPWRQLTEKFLEDNKKNRFIKNSR